MCVFLQNTNISSPRTGLKEVPWLLSPFWLKRNGALFRPNTIIITHGFRRCIFQATLVGVRGAETEIKSEEMTAGIKVAVDKSG